MSEEGSSEMIDAALASEWLCLPFGDSEGHKSTLPVKLATRLRELEKENAELHKAVAGMTDNA